jgi:hypothetical protein
MGALSAAPAAPCRLAVATLWLLAAAGSRRRWSWLFGCRSVRLSGCSGQHLSDGLGGCGGTQPSNPNGMGERWPCSAPYCSSRNSSIMRPGRVGDASSRIRVGVGTVSGVATFSGWSLGCTGSVGTKRTLRGALVLVVGTAAVGGVTIGAGIVGDTDPIRAIRPWMACV